MNNLKSHVVSYELSKQLYDLYKEKGREMPESNFYWDEYGTMLDLRKNFFNKDTIIPAYLSSELVELLPHGVETGVTDSYENFVAYNSIESCTFFSDMTEPNTRAKMLIYLLENKLC